MNEFEKEEIKTEAEVSEKINYTEAITEEMEASAPEEVIEEIIDDEEGELTEESMVLVPVEEKKKGFLGSWIEKQKEKEAIKAAKYDENQIKLKAAREKRIAEMYADGKEPNAIQKFLMADGKYINYENKSLIVFGLFVLIGIIITVVLLVNGTITKEKFGISEKVSRAIVYSKDNDVYCYDLKNEPVLISESLSAGGSATYSYVGNGTTVANDGTSVYFIDNVTADGLFSLNYFDAKKKGEPVRISDGVADYKVSELGEGVVYAVPDASGYTGTIYGYNRKTNTSAKLADNIYLSGTEYSVSTDGSKAVYAIEENNTLVLNVCSIDGSGTKTIDTDIAQYIVAENSEYVYYVKALDSEDGSVDYSIYRYNLNKGNGELIDENVLAVTLTSDQSAVLYYKYNGDMIEAADIIVDDCEGNAEYDALREEIKQYSFENVVCSVYRYENGKSQLVNDEVYNAIPMNENGSYIAYTVPYGLEEIKINLSEVSNVDQIPTLFYMEAMEAECDIYICKVGAYNDYVVFENAYLPSFLNSANNTQTACFVNFDENTQKGKLILSTYGEKGINSYAELEEDVESFQFLGDGSRITYLRGVDEDGDGTLMYIESNIPDVISENAYYYEATDDLSRKIFYLDNYVNESYGGTFHWYRQATDVVIDENVYMFSYRNDENALYMKDYNAATGTGDLYYLNGKNSVLVDENVSSVFDFYNVG